MNMKKTCFHPFSFLAAILLTVCLCIGMAGCDQTPPATTTPTTVTAATTLPSQPTAAPTTEPSVAPPATETTAAPTTEATTAPTTAPTTEPTTAPTTAPTTEPTTEPTTATTAPPAYDDSILAFFRICNATGGDGDTWKESLAIRGIIEDAWLLLYEDCTGVINLDGTQKRIFYSYDVFWDNNQVYAYSIDENKVFRYAPDYSGLELFFEQVEEAPPTVFIADEIYPKEIADAFTGEWVGIIEAESACPIPAETTARIRIQFTDEGQCQLEITFDGYKGDGVLDVTTLAIPGAPGLMIYGDFEGIPFLADSSIFAGDGTLSLWMRIGDPTSPDTYTLSAELVQPEG